MTGLDTPLQRVVGSSARKLEKAFGMRTVGDLLHHYPRRYEERGQLTDLASLQVNERATVLAEVSEVACIPMRNRPGFRVVASVTDGSGQLRLTFFARNASVARGYERRLRPGQRALFEGTVSIFRGGRELTHPQVHLLDEDDPEAAANAFAGALIPIYPAVAAVTTWSIQKSVGVALDMLGDIPDPLPDAIRQEQRLIGLRAALEGIHRPQTLAQAGRARARLRFDEAFLLQAVLAQRRASVRALPARPRVASGPGLLTAFDARLPFALTRGQAEVGDEIAADLARSHPMHRLLQGDVGSGKTVVALRAMLAVVDAGGQAALLAPTEVLAQQHHRSLHLLLGPLADAGRLGGDAVGTRVALVTGSQRSARRRTELLDVASGTAGIVVGTHALLEDVVSFQDLALVVIDEQHRFGVEQRAALAAKAPDGTRPHVLVMTATPIPRTVAMTVFGDLDVTTLADLPPGRTPVQGFAVCATDRPTHLARVWARVAEEVAAGHRAFVVCPRIGDGETEDGPADGAGSGSGRGSGAGWDMGQVADAADAADAGGGDGADGGDGRAGTDDDVGRPPLGVREVAATLAERELAGLRLGVLHGRLPPEEKEDVMRRFTLPADDPRALDVLVSTTVIEVGVDVPEATVMVVLDADRFGVSQLHQLRGRVGRGSAPGLCLFVTWLPEGSPAADRLAEIAATPDGFALSRLDLRLRREGDVLGASQSGRSSSLRLLHVLDDEDVVSVARAAATDLIARDPALTSHPELAAAVAALTEQDAADYLEKG